MPKRSVVTETVEFDNQKPIDDLTEAIRWLAFGWMPGTRAELWNTFKKCCAIQLSFDNPMTGQPFRDLNLEVTQQITDELIQKKYVEGRKWEGKPSGRIYVLAHAGFSLYKNYEAADLERLDQSLPNGEYEFQGRGICIADGDAHDCQFFYAYENLTDPKNRHLAMFPDGHRRYDLRWARMIRMPCVGTE